jgi:CRP/FNR family transcriptional regulator, cyclic AMP receptor protein
MKRGWHDEVRVFEDGEIIVREGDQTREMYVVRHGEVEILKDVAGEVVLLAVLERGSFFGEMSLLESLPRSATARARGRVELLAIRAGSLLVKIRRDPSFAFEMLQQLSGRIRRLNDLLAAAAATAAASPSAPRPGLDELPARVEYGVDTTTARPLAP